MIDIRIDRINIDDRRHDSARNFVLHAWLASSLWTFGHADTEILRKRHDEWPPDLMEYYTRVIDTIRASTVWLATDGADKDTFVGFVCCAPGAIHYLFVKWAYRRQGIAKRLISTAAHGEKIKQWNASTKNKGFEDWMKGQADETATTTATK